MATSFSQIKKQALQKRLDDTVEEYLAAINQIGRTLSDVDSIKLRRQVKDLEVQMENIEKEVIQIEDDSKVKDEPLLLPTEKKIFGIGSKWALLVGVNDYEDRSHFHNLHVCEQDVQSIYKAIADGGFKKERMRILTDNSQERPSRNNILTSLINTASLTENDDTLLFYYSGHGDLDQKESYLVGSDGRHLALSDTAVSITRIKEILDGAKARAKIIILDSCHSGAQIGEKGIKPMSVDFIQRVFEQAEGLVILSACQQNQLSYELPNESRSVFTHYLLDALSGKADLEGKGFVTAQDINRYVTDNVKMWSNQHNVVQTPTFQSAVSGDIILVYY
jgi:uncharacterized caspase-like protein